MLTNSIQLVSAPPKGTLAMEFLRYCRSQQMTYSQYIDACVKEKRELLPHSHYMMPVHLINVAIDAINHMKRAK